MQVKFSEVGLNERFTFVDDNTGWIGDCIKISSQRYAICTTRHPIIVRTRYTARLCNVDNTCTCTEPRPLTFDDLSIGSIFQFGSVWYSAADIEHKYVKVDKLHYSNFKYAQIINITYDTASVCTSDHVHSAQ